MSANSAYCEHGIIAAICRICPVQEPWGRRQPEMACYDPDGTAEPVRIRARSAAAAYLRESDARQPDRAWLGLVIVLAVFATGVGIGLLLGGRP